MIKFLKPQTEINDTVCEAFLFCESDDIDPALQGMIPAQVWKHKKALEANPKWGPGMMSMMKDEKGKPVRLAFKGNLKILFGNIRDENGEVNYKSILKVLKKLDENYEKLGIATLAMVLPGVESGREHGILRGMVVDILRKIFGEPNPGERLYVEVYQTEAQ